MDQTPTPKPTLRDALGYAGHLKIKIPLIDNRNWDFEKFVWVVLKYLALDLNFYFFFDKS